MQLIGQYDSPFVRRVAIALTRYGFAFENLPYSVMGDWAQFVDLNPLRRVPTLVLDDGEALFESGAILDCLDERADRERVLIAASGPKRRAALRRIALATGVADKAVSFFYMRLFASGVSADFAARSQAQIAGGLAALDRECAARPDDWWHGATPGHDDIAAACVARFVSEAYADTVSLDDYPAFAAHCAAAEARPEFVATLKPFDPPR
jgi:glutathione S-transferase